jgi:hypothetical protein
MKYITGLLIVLFAIVSCRKEAVPKPDDLLSKEKMADILHDITLINAMKGVDKKKLEASILHYDTYIYKKHDIDSARFFKSNNYYAANPEEYDKIYVLVEAKLQQKRTQIQVEMEKEKKQKDSIRKAQKEALKKKDTLPKPTFNQVEKK